MSEQNERVLDQFSQQAQAYASLVNATSQAIADPLIELTAPRSEDRVLDVGCGTGQFVVKIAPLVAHATGADLTPAMLDQARALQRRECVSNASWEQADSAALPFKDASFTLVVSRSMLHHAADPLSSLAEMRRVCDTFGRIAVMDLSPDASRAPAFDAFEMLRDPSHARTLSHAELRLMGQQLGLEEIAARSRTSSLPFEAVLATSFPSAGMLERVRALLMRDLDAGGDAFGLRPEIRDGKLWVTYPMTVVVWRR